MVFPFGVLAPDGRKSGHQWHSKLPRFDPAYLHQKVVNSTRIHDFFFIFCKKVVVVKFKKHSRPPFRPLVFHLKIKYSRGGISWLVYFLCFHWFFVFAILAHFTFLLHARLIFEIDCFLRGCITAPFLLLCGRMCWASSLTLSWLRWR